LDRARLERVRRAFVGHTVTALGDVAVACRRAADGDALRVRRAVRRVAAAVLGEIAGAGHRAALDRGRFEGVRRTVGADAIAALGNVARAGGGAADRRALHVGGARRRVAAAVLGEIAGTGHRAALDRPRL